MLLGTNLLGKLQFIVPLCLAPGLAMPDPAAASVDHEFAVHINPERNEVRVKDRITLPPGATELMITSDASDLEWEPAGVREKPGPPGKRLFVLAFPDARRVSLEYTLPVTAPESPSGSAAKGVSLGGGAPWYPVVPGHMLTFTLSVMVPRRWHVVSQGERSTNEISNDTRRVVWREAQPQQEAYLIAAPFTEYLRESGEPQLMAFLRRPDDALANRYLDLAARYIAMYEEMIGEYPYAKFALVENTWESGFGMPSFTLLGPRVIRLPFIPYTSYPHEILHNWWGNSVYVDPRGGNWSEGLTTYLADHWLKEQRGEGAAYRRDALQAYRNFVSSDEDFPLTRFRARHGEASQAVGYNKSMMLFHMLRMRLGDEGFFSGLRRFYRGYRFKEAGFADLEQVFTRSGGTKLKRFFDQWLTRSGAPVLALEAVGAASRGERFTVTGRLRQTQPGAVYSLEVPVRVTTRTGVSRYRVALDARQIAFELELDQQPVSIAVDPEFDLFRKPAAAELPPSFGAAYGKQRLHFIVPRDATESERAAYEAFVDLWRGPDREVRTTTDTAPLPDAGAVWLLGWDNARRPLLETPLRAHGVSFSADAVEFADTRHARVDHTVVLAARIDGARPLLWTHFARADPGRLARRLRHYSRASHIAFKDGKPVSRGQWPVIESPLTKRFTELR